MSESKSNHLAIRLLPEQVQTLKEAARAAGLTASTFARHILLQELSSSRERVSVTETDDDTLTAGKLLRELLTLQAERPHDFEELPVFVEVITQASHDEACRIRALPDEEASQVEQTVDVLAEGQACTMHVHEGFRLTGGDDDELQSTGHFILLSGVMWDHDDDL